MIADTKSQTELALFKEPAGDDANVHWLEEYLKNAGGWMLAIDLERLVGKESHAGRWVRQLANASEWVISGQKGYKHLEHSTAEEVNHFANAMESQGKKMFSRAERIRRNAHAIFAKRPINAVNH